MSRKVSFIWTDHKTLECFEKQCDLSRRQARWMEFLSQYDASINYIPGDKNCVADALSRLPESPLRAIGSLFSGTPNKTSKSTLELDTSLLCAIKDGYVSDPFVTKLTSACAGMDCIKQKNGFWFINDRLIIPDVKHVRETLFRLVHDSMGHFSSGKCYPTLRNSFYWPNMWRDLEKAYIPSCATCQIDKSKTTKPVSPLHPLPVPDERCDSVAIDFIGPLPLDNGFDTIITFTDRLGSDIQIVPSVSTLTADQLADMKALHILTGVKLKMSTAYHPETDGSSKRTNKTVIQCIRFAVERD